MHRLQALFAGIAIATCASLAHAGTLTKAVIMDFDDPAPSSTGFHPSVNVPLGISFPFVATLTSVEFSADFEVAAYGDFSAEHRSSIQVDYPDQIPEPGLATINLRQTGLSNSFSENSPGVEIRAGAEAFIDPSIGSNFSIPVDVINVDLFIDTNDSNGGALSSTLTDNDSASAARLAVGIAVPLIDIGTAGATPTLSGTSTVNVGSSIAAVLSYRHQDMPGIMGMMDVSLAGLSDAMVDLPEPGFYDFELAGYRLGGTRTSTTTPGVTVDLTVFNNVVASKFLGIPGSSQTSTDGFTYLPTNPASQSFAFTIEVLNPVPEPSTIVLGLAGVFGLAACVRRRR